MPKGFGRVRALSGLARTPFLGDDEMLAANSGDDVVDRRDRIVVALGEKSISGRRRAYDQVQGMEASADDLELFLPSFHDDDPLIRRHTVTLLGKLRVNDATIKLLKEALRDGDWVVREAAIESMSSLGSPWVNIAIDALTGASLHDRKPLIREISLRGLQRITTEEDGHGLVEAFLNATRDHRSVVRCRAIEGLTLFHRFSPEAIKRLNQCGNDSHVKVRKAVIRAALKLGQDASPLIPMLSKRRFEVDQASRDGVASYFASMRACSNGQVAVALQIVGESDDPSQCLDQLLVNCCGEFEMDMKKLCLRRLEWIAGIHPNITFSPGVEREVLPQLVAMTIHQVVIASQESLSARTRKQQIWFIEQVMQRVCGST